MNNFLKIKPLIYFFIFLFSASLSYSQSDYKIVQNFKESLAQVEGLINKAKSLEELNSLAKSLDKIRTEYLEHKELLDKSLYPDNFEKSFDKLDLAYVVRTQDFKIIDVLQNENLQLNEQVAALNKNNSELMNKIQDIELSIRKNNKKERELKLLVAELKKSLNKRDELIFSIVDSLMPNLMKGEVQLTNKEKGDIYIKSEKNNLVENIIKSLQDNIRFIYMTTLTPGDLKDIQKQQAEFSEFWQDVGVKLVDVYTEKGNKTGKISEIDSLYNKWTSAVEKAAWINIRQEFAFRHIILNEFYDDNKFTTVITSFIDEEIRNIGIKNSSESETSYEMFVDSAWNKVMEKRWLSFLVEEEILSGMEVNRIESKITYWHDRLSPQSYDWIYVVVIVGAVTGLAFMNRKRIFKRSNQNQ